MSTAASRLLKMLIDVSCFQRVSWTGKGGRDKIPNIALKQQNNIQKVLLETLKHMDASYTKEALHSDIVYKILKFVNVKKN